MIGIKYATFAVFAIGVNLLFQYLAFRVYSESMSLYIAMSNGTIVGMICKYILDNKYIFFQSYDYRRRRQKIYDLFCYRRASYIGILCF